MIVGVNDLVLFRLKRVEVLGNGRENVLRHILGTMVGAPRRASPTRLMPLNLRVKRIEDGGNVPPVERLGPRFAWC